LAPVDPAFFERLPYARLILVHLGGVDMPVPTLQSPADRAATLGPPGPLPDAEPKQRHLVTIREFARGPGRAGGHRCSSTGGYGRLTRVSVIRLRWAGSPEPPRMRAQVAAKSLFRCRSWSMSAVFQ